MPEADKSLPQTVGELWDLTKTYATQETVEPLKGLARYVGFGFGGALLLGVGVILLMLAGLRALQTQTGDLLVGDRSWAPYLIVLVVGALFAALAAWRIGSKSGGPR